MTRPLRIGVMLGRATTLAAWEAKILRDIAASDFAELALLILDDRPVRSGRWQRVKSRQWSTFLYDLYVRVDRKMYRANADAFARVDIGPELASIPTLRVRPVEERYIDRFGEDDLRVIREADLDVILRLGFRILKGPILETARYGVWSYHHGDNAKYRGGPPFFWEIDRRDPVSGSVLQILGDKLDAGRVIYRSWSATNMTSLYRNSNANYWKTAEFVVRRLRDVHRLGEKALEPLPPSTTGPLFRKPRNGAMLRFLARQASLWLKRRLAERRYREQWQLAVRERRDARTPFACASLRFLVPPPDRSYADVMLFERDGRTWLFFEEIPFGSGKGVITVAELLPDRFGPARVVLERPYHLSYPFLFADGDTIYMLPETKQNQQIELYRATDFPHAWALDSVLIENVLATDATLLQRDGRWWMFVNIATPGASTNDELHVFHADHFRGPWAAHASNPVVSDVRRARPAGPLFVDEQDRLVRPSQDSSLTYGYAVVLNHVERLTPGDYAETPIGRIEPSWMPGAVGVHTYSRGERHEAIDVRVRIRRSGR